MRKIKKEEYLHELQEKESQMKETEALTVALKDFVSEVRGISADTLVLWTDYDADGICSAYILSKTLASLFPKKDIQVKVNDRRNGYGTLSSLSREKNVQNFVLDMGSNSLGEIEAIAPNTFVIDHHLTENVAKIRGNHRYLNPKTFYQGGDYCTTGLCYRIFELCKEEQPELFSKKLENTISAISAIGTIADVVDLCDMYSDNRKIVKKGMQAINNATKENFDETVGFLIQNACSDLNGETGRDITASDIRMNVAPYINGAGRMSEIVKQNGAQMMFDALSSSELTGYQVSWLNEVNKVRKSLSSDIKRSKEFQKFLEDNLKEFKVNVFLVDAPHALCGILAGTCTEAVDAPVLCLTYNEKTKTYSGSGRNSKNTLSLKEWCDTAFGDMDIQYGGHHGAIGISKIKEDDFPAFLERIRIANQEHPIQRTEDDFLILDEKPSLVAKDNALDTLLFLQRLEPLSESIYVIAENKATKGAMISGCPIWKTKTFTENGVKFAVKDWSFNEQKYTQNKVLLELSTDTYGGVSVGFTSVYKRQFNEQEKEKEKIAVQK